MARNLSRLLTVKTIKEAGKGAIARVQGRRKGTIKSLLCSHTKVNNTILNGFEWNRIATIGAMSGSGKSVLIEQWKRGFCQLNKDENGEVPFEILSFEFEMSSEDQLLRNVSAITGFTYQKLLSADEILTDEEYKIVEEAVKELTSYPIFPVDEVGTVDSFVNTIKAFAKTRNLKGRKKGLIITLDHVLLTEGKNNEDERKIVTELYQKTVRLQKELNEDGLDTLFFFLSQFNREIEKIERKSNPEYHYPNRNDLFGASAIFMCSDYIFAIHKPQILNLQTYGLPSKKFPRGMPIVTEQGQPFIYIHVLKQRYGKPRILMMLDNFKNAKIDEY